MIHNSCPSPFLEYAEKNVNFISLFQVALMTPSTLVSVDALTACSPKAQKKTMSLTTTSLSSEAGLGGWQHQRKRHGSTGISPSDSNCDYYYNKQLTHHCQKKHCNYEIFLKFPWDIFSILFAEKLQCVTL